MRYYSHNLAKVEDHLHHRPPYLLIDKIVDCNPSQIVTEKLFTGEEFFVPGHFPGAPILPGAMMQEMSTQSAGILIAKHFNPMDHFSTEAADKNEFALGVLVGVKQARYRGFARPGDTLRATVQLNDELENLFQFSATIQVGDRSVMNNIFRLANIPSDLLTGAS